MGLNCYSIIKHSSVINVKLMYTCKTGRRNVATRKGDKCQNVAFSSSDLSPRKHKTAPDKMQKNETSIRRPFVFLWRKVAGQKRDNLTCVAFSCRDLSPRQVKPRSNVRRGFVFSPQKYAGRNQPPYERDVCLTGTLSGTERNAMAAFRILP